MHHAVSKLGICLCYTLEAYHQPTWNPLLSLKQLGAIKKAERDRLIEKRDLRKRRDGLASTHQPPLTSTTVAYRNARPRSKALYWTTLAQVSVLYVSYGVKILVAS